MSPDVPDPTSPALAAELADAVVVDFPLRGEDWVAVNSPADRIPSHGTDMLGQRFAFDFIRVDDRPGLNAHPAGKWRGLLIGGRAQECYAWGAPVHAPFDGEVVRAVDGVKERAWLHPVREIAHALINAVTFTPSRLPRILGNHVVVRAMACSPRSSISSLAAWPCSPDRPSRRGPAGPGRAQWQLDDAPPASPADGLGRPDDRQRHPVRVPRLRGASRRRLGTGAGRIPGKADRIRAVPT